MAQLWCGVLFQMLVRSTVTAHGTQSHAGQPQRGDDSPRYPALPLSTTSSTIPHVSTKSSSVISTMTRVTTSYRRYTGPYKYIIKGTSVGMVKFVLHFRVDSQVHVFLHIFF